MFGIPFFAVLLFSANFRESLMFHPPTTSVPLDKTYDARFDSIDIDEVLKQERLLKNYIKCLEQTGTCTADAKLLRDILPEAVSTNCEKCSNSQKIGSTKVTHFLIDNRPSDWARLEKIYDPEGNFRRLYLNEKSKLH